MFRKKSWMVVMSVMILFCLLLAACSSDTQEDVSENGTGNETPVDTPSGDDTTSSEEPVEIVLSGWGASPEEAELLQQVLEDFEEKYPYITVKHDVIGDQYMDVIRTRLIAGEGPDVFYLDSSEAPALIQTGVLEPLDDYVTEDFDIKDFEQPLLEAFQQDGVTYGFPKDYSTLALFYNKKLFEEAGIDGPPATWDEMREISGQLTQGTEQYGLGVQVSLDRLFFIAQSQGGQVVSDDMASFASPEVVEALQPFVDQYLVDGTSTRSSDVGAEWGGDIFGRQLAAMVIEGNWAIPFLEQNFPELEFGTAEVPTINGMHGTMAYTVAYVMNRDSDKKDAAWKLIEYLTGKEGMETWTSKGFALPSRQSVAEINGFDQDEHRAALVAGASYATPWQAGVNLPIINTNFNNQFESAFLGNIPLDEALEEAQQQANSEIQ